MPTRSASVKYATSDSDMPSNPAGYLPGSYTTEHIGRERSRSSNTSVESTMVERARSYTVHDNPGSNGGYNDHVS